MAASSRVKRGFKLPAGVKMTAKGAEMRRRRTIGARMAMCKPVSGSAFKKMEATTPDHLDIPEGLQPALDGASDDSGEEGEEEEVVDIPPPDPDDTTGLPEGVMPLVLFRPPEDGNDTESTVTADGDSKAGEPTDDEKSGDGEAKADDDGEAKDAEEEGDGPPPKPKMTPVVVDRILTKFLRQHQREGVQFVFDCLTGNKGFAGNGCILADDMGLGKTLQSITILWTLLRQGMHGKPTVKRAVIVCPTSLVKNWSNELKKWLHGQVEDIALSEASREVVSMEISRFLAPKGPNVLIISYETFRIHAERFYGNPEACELLICDEAHRLKNDKTLTTTSLGKLPCRRRLLLSGTPMQNDLFEFFAMVDFTNPGILGKDGAAFRRRYEGPILRGREPWATERELEAATNASTELSAIVNQFILRRTNTLLSKHLPPKLVQVVVIKMSPLQEQLYQHFMSSKATLMLLSGRQTGVLSSITALKKLCNHPKLVYQASRSLGGDTAPGFEDCDQFFPPNFHRERAVLPAMSGKFEVLDRMLRILRSETTDRIVIVSNYTQTLDLVTTLCRENSYPCLRLDGSTGSSKRQKLVDQFNDHSIDQFVFLLSSKAGGCGLNLVGGNRLILFDPDWNPATDKQAAARVWRDGQRKRVYIYRFLARGTLEEKVYQRQLSKEGLQTRVVDEKNEANKLSSDDLSNLFSLESHTPSDTHDRLRCRRCLREEGVDSEGEEDEYATAAAAAAAAVANGTATAAAEAEAARAAKAAEKDGAAAGAGAPVAAAGVEDVDLEVEAEGGEEGGEEGSIAPSVAPSSAAPSMAPSVAPSTEASVSAAPSMEPTPPPTKWACSVCTLENDMSRRKCDVCGAKRPPKAASDSSGGDGDGDGDGDMAMGEEDDAFESTPVVGDKKQKKKKKKKKGKKPDVEEPEEGGRPKRKGRKRNRKTAEEMEYEKLVKETLQERLPDAPPGTMRKQIGNPAEEDLKKWAHHHGVETVDDDVLKVAGKDLVTFVFGLHVEGMDLSLFKQPEPAKRPGAGGRGPPRRSLHGKPGAGKPSAMPVVTAAGGGVKAAVGGKSLIRRRFPSLHARKPGTPTGIRPKPAAPGATPKPSSAASGGLADSVSRL